VSRPNILFFMTDQHRWDALGCVSDWVETPNIDRIAGDGVRFSNAYTNAPTCVPARVSLAIGRYPHNHGVWRHMRYTLSPREPTWMAAIRAAGYATSVFGKTHLHPQAGDLRDREHLLHAYGLDHVDELTGPRASLACRSNLTDRWQEAGVYGAYKQDLRDRYASRPWVTRPTPLPLELYPDVYVGQQAAAYLRSYDGAEPWFCWVSFPGPHEPWDAPEPYASRYDPASMPLPVEPSSGGRARPRGVLDEKLAESAIAFEPGEIARLRANYAGKVTLIDDQIGEVMRAVDERGDLDRTVVAVVSDHGEMNGDYSLLYKGTFLDPAVRIPFVLRLPPGNGTAAGSVSSSPVELMDIGATLSDIAGASPVKRSVARSVLPAIEGSGEPPRRVAVSELRREVMLATPDWKIARNRRGEVYLLHDLRNDPLETRNLAALPGHQNVERALGAELAGALRRGRALRGRGVGSALQRVRRDGRG
jgi:choline-sulfatase